MIIIQPRSWWECVMPKLEEDEEEIWFTHPTLNIRCNQLGALDFSEDEFLMVQMSSKGIYLRKKSENGKFVLSVGTKSNLVWECYNQKTTNSRITHKNHNELDFTFDNLYCTEGENGYQRTMRTKIKKAWEARSARILLEKEKIMAAKGLDKETYRELLILPSWLTSAADSLV